MRRFLVALSLAVSLSFVAAVAQAGIVEFWDVKADVSISGFVQRSGSDAVVRESYNPGMWGTNSELEWTNAYGENFRAKSSVSNQFALEHEGGRYGYFLAGSVFSNFSTIAPNIDPTRKSDIQSVTFKYDLVFSARDNSGINFEFSFEIPLYFFIGNTGLEGDLWGEGLQTIVKYGDLSQTCAFVYNGMSYTFDIWLYNGGGGWPAKTSLSDSIYADEIMQELGLTSSAGYGFLWEPGHFELGMSGKAPMSAVPVPAAVWLFGTSLAGLAAAKRRMKK